MPLMLGFDPGYLLTMFSIVIDSIMVWYICTGIMRLAAVRDNRDLASTAETRRRWYAIAAIVSLTVSCLRLVSPEVAALLVIPVVALALASGTLVVLLMRRASVEIAG